MQWVRNVLKKILPDRFIEWYRRKRAVRQYLGSLSYEIYDRTIRFEVEDLEGRIAARRHGFYQSLVKDVLERTELVLQELDRKIEGVNARHGNELRSLREEVESLRASVEALRREANISSTPGAGIPAGSSEPGVPAGVRPASDR
jgi:hypothetical protein